MEAGIQKIPLELIDRDPSQPRSDFDEEGLQELARSIETNGLLQPISLRKNGRERHVIMAGERRFLAVKSLGWTEVPAIVFHVNDTQFRKLQMIENCVREQLNPLEVARGYKQMMDEGMTAADIAGCLGQNAGNVTYYVRILDCCPAALSMVSKQQLSIIVAHALATLSFNGQYRALRTFQLHAYSANEMVSICEKIYAEENRIKLFDDMPLTDGEIKQVRSFELAFTRLYKTFGRLEKLDKVKPGSAARVKLLRAHIKEMESKLRWLDKILMRKEAVL